MEVVWWFLKISGDENNGLAEWTGTRLAQLEAVRAEREQQGVIVSQC